MIGLFRENVKIAMGSIRAQLLRTILTVIIIAIGITALVGILTVVTAIEYNLNSSFASMGSNTFNINQYESTGRRRGNEEIEKINPIISYPEARAFKECLVDDDRPYNHKHRYRFLAPERNNVLSFPLNCDHPCHDFFGVACASGVGARINSCGI